MKFFPSRKVFLEIGSNVSIRWYAILIILGATITYLLTKHDMKKAKYINRNDFLDDFFILVLWVGIIGARLWYCAFYDIKAYIADPIQILRVYDGGLAIHGGVIFGLIAGYFFCKKRNVSYLKVLDCTLPNVLIAQAVGRWGNFINQECHGPAVDESYFNGVLSFIKNGMNINGTYYMPMFFYESMACLVGIILIRLVIAKKFHNKRGDLAWSYLMWYGIVRLYVETKRTDALLVGSLKIAEIISLLFIVAGVLGYVGLFERFFKKKKPTIIFDFDGTLINTDGSILGSFKELYRLHDDEKNFTKEIQDYVLGPAIRDVFPKLFPGLDVEMLVDEYHKAQEKILYLNEPCKNAELVLKTLKEEGYNIGIVSTRQKDGVIARLKQFDLDKYIDDIYGLYEVVKLKPDPEGLFGIIKDNKWNGDDVIYVGDSIADVDCAYNYGAYTVAYISREDRREQMKSSHANVCIDDLSQVLDIVKEKHYFTYNLK